MDDSEFRTRAFSNPLDDQDDFRAAVDAHPDRRRLMDELKALEVDLQQTLRNVAVPDGLQQKLYRHGRSAAPLLHQRSPYLLAASLIITAGLGLSLMQARPSAQDIAFHDSLVDHLHQEAPRYSDAPVIQWQQVEDVMRAAGATLHASSEILSLHLTFANHCGLGLEAHRGAHIVAQGEYGPVSIIFVRNTPVSANIKLRDERFKGRIIPLAEGNMAVIGEKNEALGKYERLLRDNFEWSI
jgi:hypothetical protein